MSSLPDQLSIIRAAKLRNEEETVSDLLAQLQLSPAGADAIETSAAKIIEGMRAPGQTKPVIDQFLHEYGLTNQEGVALMCLAEALVRVPDAATRDDLIADKIALGDWGEHLGKSDALFINASTWGLLLTGRIVQLGAQFSGKPATWLSRLINRSGEPVIRAAMGQAMRILGGEFVLGETIEGALNRGRRLFGNSQIYSFDMLGEGARTGAQAARHFDAYAGAIRVVGALDKSQPIRARSGVSVKLSALHPRYEFAQRDRVLTELGKSILTLATQAAEADIKFSIDAEEADRLDLSLDLFEMLARAPGLDGWEGLGLVVQAYGKRAVQVIDWLGRLAEETGRRFMVRLVKGAYWDSEIKWAQESGLPDFPVFTRKASTDLSYLVCAEKLLAMRDRLYPQFATHNAHTVAAIVHLAGTDRTGIEFQRLYGMGELVYEAARKSDPMFPPVRIYAPVGGHKDLLAYLVRRLLENGANSSFVNRFMNDDLPAREVVADPVAKVRANLLHRHPDIRLPGDIFRPRQNSAGLDLTAPGDLAPIAAAIIAEKGLMHDLGAGEDKSGLKVTNPADAGDVLAVTPVANTEAIDNAFMAAVSAQRGWDEVGGSARADCLIKTADALESQTARFIALMMREAGKTHADALAEVREAVDFCRYYAAQAEEEFGTGLALPGPAGETNRLSLHGRGVFVCISPWNFPLAIFLGQVVAALAAGNAVLAKPAEQTPIIAHETIKLLHMAGVPEEVLHLIIGGGDVGARLVGHDAVAGIAFTGSTDIARSINRALAAKAGAIVPLIAETGGQNVMIADSTALLEQLTDDVIRSAFISAGQRCSALRVLYVQDDIACQAIDMISGAMDELAIGDPSLLSTDIGPVIDAEAEAKLDAHIDALKAKGTKWHATPIRASLGSGHFVQPHLFEIRSITELSKEQFGPVLHVIRYKASEIECVLDEAFATGYGLTLGVHTRMDSRWQRIFARAPVGNTYVNRNMVGAVVGSQPFGGQGLSGTGFKAGGPHYLTRFATERTLTINTMATGGNAELLTL